MCIELAGIGCAAAAAWLFEPVLGLLAVGVGLFYVAQGIE